jgi:hypothetical protein
MKLFPIILAILLFLCGCDKFFTIDALVVDNSTNQPIIGAKATLVLDKGVEEPDNIKESHLDGRIKMFMNEPQEAWATLTIEKDGYNKWSTQFRGAPCAEFVIRLIAEKRK